jgi:hypothetical protein
MTKFSLKEKMVLTMLLMKMVVQAFLQSTGYLCYWVNPSQALY